MKEDAENLNVKHIAEEAVCWLSCGTLETTVALSLCRAAAR